MNTPQIDGASVKVMRSYDYCHFEVTLSASFEYPLTSKKWFSRVDALRKNAARLADKAVEQYKVAKSHAELSARRKNRLEYEADHAEGTPESERTPEQKAAIKALADYHFNARRYDYQDDWNEEVDND